MLIPNKPGKLGRVCNAAANYKDVCPNDNLLGVDLLLELIGAISQFCEGLVALTANIRSTFLQEQVFEQDRISLRLLWCLGTNKTVQIFKYQRHVFGAKRSPTCANSAIRQLGHNNEERYPIAPKLIQKSFYTDGLIKSKETREEAVAISSSSCHIFISNV